MQRADLGVGDGAAADGAEHFGGTELGAGREGGLQVRVGDATRPVPGATSLDRFVGAASEQPLTLGHRTFEGLVLQPVQRVVVDERGHRALAGQQVPPVLERVGQVLPRAR